MLQTVLEWIELHIGLKISDSRLHDFEKSLRLAASECGFDNPNEYITNLVRGRPNPRDMSFVARFITVGETYFFRDPLSYSVLINSILPSLDLQDRQALRIWSAGCATGEEPYSLAMTALSAGSDRTGTTIEILGTDINPASIETARKGLYRRWSFRDVPGFIKEKYFTMSADERYIIDDEIKNMVKLSHLNLASDSYPSVLTGTENVDVIFCRNVLIYFSAKQATAVLAKFHDCLNDGGYLFLAPSEIPHPVPDNFSLINMQGAIVLRKEIASKNRKQHEVHIVKSNYSYFGKADATGFKSFESMVDTSACLIQPPEPALSAGLLEASDGFEQSDVDKLYAQGKYHQVIDQLMKLPSAAEQSAESLTLIARSYANLGNLEAAIDWCDQLIASDSVNPKWYYLKATIQQEQDQQKEAMASLRQSIFLDQEYVLAHFSLGNLYRQHGNLTDSRRCFENVVRLLKDIDQSETVPDSDGLTAGQLISIVNSFAGSGN